MISTDVKRGTAFATRLVKKAEKERDTKGYRENLGYDQARKLDAYLGKLDLTYSEEAQITKVFFKQCDNI